MSTATSPALPAFSYAQAAKGKSLQQISPQQSLENAATTKDSSAAGSKSSAPDPSKIELSERMGPPQPVNERRESPSASPSNQPTIADNAASIPNGTGIAAESNSANSTGATADAKQVSMTSSPSFGTASTSTLPKEDEITFTPNGSSDSTWDKQSQVSTSAEKSTQTVDGSKDKLTETSWSETPTVPPESLYKAAPIPVVNIWQQRKEAQEAKAKANATLKPSTLNQPAQKARGTQIPEHPVDQVKPGSDQNKGAPKKKGAPGVDRDDTVGLKERRRTGEPGKAQEDGKILSNS